MRLRRRARVRQPFELPRHCEDCGSRLEWDHTWVFEDFAYCQLSLRCLDCDVTYATGPCEPNVHYAYDGRPRPVA
jgi:hypothetical protein